MPHQCTNCGRRFPDGSKEMLTGCPDCGGKKFQFTPASRMQAEQESAGDESRHTTDTQSTLQEAVGSDGGGDDATDQPASVDRSDAPATSEPGDPTQEHGTDAMEDDFEWVGGEEDDAQATARTDIVSPDELPAHGRQGESSARGSTATERSATEVDATPSDASSASVADTDRPDTGHGVSEPAASNPSIDELRKELDQQFESIKILNPGQYELNLMELYNREEHIIALREDGRYVINVPESWHDGP